MEKTEVILQEYPEIKTGDIGIIGWSFTVFVFLVIIAVLVKVAMEE